MVFEARESLTGTLVLLHLPPPEHQSQPESVPSVAGQPAPPSTLSAAPSSRPTLRLDKPKRSAGEGAGSGPSAGAMPEVSLSLRQEDHSQRSRAPQESRGYQPRVSFSPRQRAQPRIQRSGARPLGRVSLSPPQGHRQGSGCIQNRAGG